MAAGGQVIVAGGTYGENVVLNKTLTLTGAGPATTTIMAPIGSTLAAVRASAENIVVEGFTITRAGNNLTDWNGALSGAGVAIQGQTASATIRDNVITGNRTGIDINNSDDNTVRGNSISNNRTGLLLRNRTDNTVVESNLITGNWTVGILFLDASSGSNSPVQTAANSTFSRNDISGNWYGGAVDRQTGGSLPAPGANLKNFTCNWWGTTSPVTSTANSAEPGYAALIPVEFGGSATNPGGAPDILGEASANITYQPWLVSSDLVGDCMGGTARGFKSIALSQLQAIGSTGIRDTDKRIADAIVKIASSLARPNWVDDDRIDGRHAERIFRDERSAATSLQGIKGTKPAGVMTALESLVTADRIIAQTAIDDAAGGDPKALAEAAKAMLKADEALAKGRYDTAIEQYRIAWNHAKKA